MAPVVRLRSSNHQLAPSIWPRCCSTQRILDRRILRLGGSRGSCPGSAGRITPRSSSSQDKPASAPDTEGAPQQGSEGDSTPQAVKDVPVQTSTEVSSSASVPTPHPLPALDEEWNPAADWAEEWADPDSSQPPFLQRAAGEQEPCGMPAVSNAMHIQQQMTFS